MLQGSKIILVISGWTLLLFCVPVIWPVVEDCRSKCCCSKGGTHRGLSVGCVLFCLPAGSPLWAQRQSTELWLSSEKFRSPLSWENALVWEEEKTQCLKWNCAGCLSALGSGYQGMRVLGAELSALKTVLFTHRVAEQDVLTPAELFCWGFWGI